MSSAIANKITWKDLKFEQFRRYYNILSKYNFEIKNLKESLEVEIELIKIVYNLTDINDMSLEEFNAKKDALIYLYKLPEPDYNFGNITIGDNTYNFIFKPMEMTVSQMNDLVLLEHNLKFWDGGVYAILSLLLQPINDTDYSFQKRLDNRVNIANGLNAYDGWQMAVFFLANLKNLEVILDISTRLDELVNQHERDEELAKAVIELMTT